MSDSEIIQGRVVEIGMFPEARLRVRDMWYPADSQAFYDANYHRGHGYEVEATVRDGRVTAVAAVDKYTMAYGRLDNYTPDQIVVGGRTLRCKGWYPEDQLAEWLNRPVVVRVDGAYAVDVFEARVVKGARIAGVSPKSSGASL